MEKAPGPRKTLAADIMTIKKAAKPESSKFGVGAGNNASAIPPLPKPTIATASGVRNPINSETPLATASKPTTLIPNVWLPQLASTTTP